MKIQRTNCRSITVLACTLALASLSTIPARGDVFQMPSGSTSMQFVPIGDAGNVGDENNSASAGIGAVSYNFQMGKYDTTSAQYAQFLNAVATTSDPYGLYNPYMATSIPCGITKSTSAGVSSYAVVPGDENFPVNWITWGDAARFCNWLQNGQPAGVEGPTTTENGAYTLSGATSAADLSAVTRNPGAVYFLPSADEWHKAAYYQGGGTSAGYWIFPTQSNTPPSNVLSATGSNNANYSDFSNPINPATDPIHFLTSVGAFADSPGPYGTFDQGGDVEQWTDSYGGYPETKQLLGGSFFNAYDAMESWNNDVSSPDNAESNYGFRIESIAAVPEPQNIRLAILGIVLLSFYTNLK